MTLKLAIFDCDGVLVDSEGATNALMAEDLIAHGLPIAEADIPPLFIGGTMEGVFETAKSLGAALADDWVARFYEKMFARLDEGVPLIPGILELIAALEAEQIAIWVASNGPMEKMRRTLGPSGLWDRLQGRILSREHFTPKPDPAMILHAMAETGAQVEETVFIDDSPTGCRAGINAGVKTYGFAAETDPARLSEVGATVIHNMADLHPLLLPRYAAQ